MIQNVLREIGGVGLYGIISVLLFFTVFSTAMWWAFSQRKQLLNQMGALPLVADDGSDREEGGKTHE